MLSSANATTRDNCVGNVISRMYKVAERIEFSYRAQKTYVSPKLIAIHQ